MKKETIIITSIALVFFIGFGFLIYKAPSFNAPKQVETATLVKSGSRMTGSITAKVQVVEFGDFECPACAQVHPMVKSVLAEYEGNPDVNFVFRNFPLPQHSRAVVAAEAAEAAGDQGKYFEMFDLLYTGQNEWVEAEDPMTVFTSYATSIGLDLAKFNSDMESHKHAPKINADKVDGNTIPIQHTPTIFVNGSEVTNLANDGLKSAIDSSLNK